MALMDTERIKALHLQKKQTLTSHCKSSPFTPKLSTRLSIIGLKKGLSPLPTYRQASQDMTEASPMKDASLFYSLDS